MQPEISVVIPTFNRRSMLSEAVASALASRNVRLEVIVIDDGSSDATWDYLQHLQHRSNPGAAIRIARQPHRGPASARNRGIALAQADFVAFLDSDDLWSAQKAAGQLAFMRENPRYSMSQCQELWLRNGRRINPARRHIKRAGDIFLDSLRTCLISPSTVIVRTELLRCAGGFDESMAACEDYDLWLRLLVDHEVGLLDEPLATRRAGHPDQLSATTPALDRFRILALAKLLALDRISGLRRKAIVEAFAEKCRIYAGGLARRGISGNARLFMELAARAQEEWSGQPDFTLIKAIDDLRSVVNAPDASTLASSGLDIRN